MGDNNENTDQPQLQQPNPHLPNPPSIQDLIAQNLNELRGIAEVYRRIPRLNPLFDPLTSIVKSMETMTKEHDATLLWRDSMKEKYADGLLYKDIKDLEISKAEIPSLFVNPHTGQPVDPKKIKLSIKWCTNDGIVKNFWDRWWMVFDKPPNNNLDIPFYFIKKLYPEFVLQKHVNYFDIQPFQGVGLGMPQNRPGAVRVVQGPYVPPPPVDPPPAVQHPDIICEAASRTISAIHSLSSLLVSQAASVAQPTFDGSGASGGADTSSSTPHICVPHSCVMCGHVCLGPVGQPVDPAVDSADYEVHAMHDAPEVITQTGGYIGESSHARGEEAPSSYIDDVLLMTEDELRQIQEGTLSAISFGLDSLTGTSSTSVVQCDLGSGSAIGDKGKRILGFTSLMTTPDIPEEEEEMPRVDVVYENIQNIPPLPKTYIKSPAKLKRKRGDEDPSEPSSVAKRIDFDDPSAA
ncbi:uncharacterized protein LOC131060013 isoform X1 [Cryptomeria japonica]|uniref:uncharacterized protein LOC131060013 isoform X1 n=1 Tax=Cryptomeria japonica TaxID=3369 RepID=UPI0027DA3D20|nr:uncharacterized protein LOC131060013 isoform X1 [Cryptomeria japonica]